MMFGENIIEVLVKDALENLAMERLGNYHQC